ncbi:MAG: [FeFe] hydrogenase, group A [Alphaproteobacteria bacterium]|nr:[FeFe] hydrogenase, group A [Alphaproteobacteria bacterium]
MSDKKTLFIDGIEVEIEGERNLLELCRKIGVDIPTFCYHPELSIFGACRLCLVEIEGRGIQSSCSVPPEAGLKIHTNTDQIRKLRRNTMELLLASHPQDCLKCPQSTKCKLQEIARKVGVTDIRYKLLTKKAEKDTSSYSIVRDPAKCILCGDCVRVCSEIQGVGALNFAKRGSNSTVITAFNIDMNKSECVNCGQCAAHCPTGALTIHSEVDETVKDINNPEKVTVVQMAPAVRVAIAEEFGMPAGVDSTKKIVTALKKLGVDYVYDTNFTADMTIVEESTEFVDRLTNGGVMPMFTSCCPAWIKYAETFHPQVLKNISSCRSPQGMFGAIVRKAMPEICGKDNKDIVSISIMPCTAKKFEARRDQFLKDGKYEIDHVLTTQELAQMLKSSGINLAELPDTELDAPLGAYTGAGVIFGVTGGVMEAVLRYAAEKVGGIKDAIEFKQVRGFEGIREAEVELNGKKLKLAIVHGLANAGKICEQVEAGTCKYDFIEVMACPGGCIGGAGQPISEGFCKKQQRAEGLYKADEKCALRKSQENKAVYDIYNKYLDGGPATHAAHENLHTSYEKRAKISADLDINKV